MTINMDRPQDYEVTGNGSEYYPVSRFEKGDAGSWIRAYSDDPRLGYSSIICLPDGMVSPIGTQFVRERRLGRAQPIGTIGGVNYLNREWPI